MTFEVVLTTAARKDFDALAANDESKFRKVQKTFGLLETNPRHPGLRSHKYESLSGPNKDEIWESYVENNTPAAFRLFWFYGPDQGRITVVRISQHP